MGDLIISHDILLEAPDFDSCHKRVSRFFETTMLIRYDEIRISRNESSCGADSDFRARIKAGLAANHQALEKLFICLRDEGLSALEDLKGIEKGYVSKTLHTIAHLLDGFIGIDSFFYNLEEDSHTITPDMSRKIEASPDSYWIVRVNGTISSADEKPFEALRTFEWKGEDSD